jgi:DNA repair protein SbcC/Rad50
MMAPRLKTLVIENFRSLRGKVVIPLDAQVVLVHGSNGMGKTSVLSALELALTGKISHLAADGDGYRGYLTTLGSTGGSIELTTSGPLKADAGIGGSLTFSDILFNPKPLLDSGDAKFFSDRCYLPQATLSRLLEIYDDQRTNTTSPLTQFVKELLGLDPLDALVDGLFPAYNVIRVRNLVPEYRRLESLRTSLRDDIARNDQSITAAERSSTDRLAALNAKLAPLPSAVPISVNATTTLHELRRQLETARQDDRVLTDLTSAGSELRSVAERWRALPAGDTTHDRANKERREQAASQALAAWRTGAGVQLDQALAVVRLLFSDVPSIDDGPEESRAIAQRRAEAEATRCTSLINNSAAATERVKTFAATIQRASARIRELNTAIAAGVEGVRTLASALAGVAPHVVGETCPVCDRDFSEVSAEPLSAHIAAKIASLTSEAGRVQSLANERAEESSRLSVAQRDLPSAEGGQLPPEDLAELTVRASQMASVVQRLSALASAAAAGTAVMAEAAAAREPVVLARRRDELSSSILPEIDRVVSSLTGSPASSFNSIDDALLESKRNLDGQIAAAESTVSLRIAALSELELYSKDLESIRSLKGENDRLAARIAIVEIAAKQVDTCRDTAKKVADAAATVRSDIVKTVFNTSLNKVWRDLFVRLAPSEQFVPTFKLPTGEGGKVEAVLETLHRSGQSSGSPGAMLSQGNLNTAALTLFLALHLSVPSRMPWLVLDDPVQSMDDVHIAQFAALLRTLSKGMGRQIVVAVHERALFEYLTLELSPAFQGDSLISVEITRNFEGNAVATPLAFSYQRDRAIAA